MCQATLVGRRGLAPLLAALLGALALPVFAQADDPLTMSVGAGVQLSGWQGENEGSSETDFDAGGGLLRLNVSLQKGRFYGGLSLTGGRFDFEEGSPDRVGPESSAPPDREATVERGEFDLLLGYWFWERVSLFLDVKSVSNEWQGESYSLRYSGLGAGVSGFVPLAEPWTLFGSFGVVPLTIRALGEDIGDGRGSALEVGVLYRLGQRTSLSFSLKNQHQEYDFDSGADQTHDLGGLAFGITHRLE